MNGICASVVSQSRSTPAQKGPSRPMKTRDSNLVNSIEVATRTDHSTTTAADNTSEADEPIACTCDGCGNPLPPRPRVICPATETEPVRRFCMECWSQGRSLGGDR